MKQTNSFIIVIIFLLTLGPFFSQAQINSFTVTERSGKNIVGWVNSNPELRQLIIQRSKDSLQGFKSIMSMPDPTAYTNGYVDKPTDTAIYFYRLFGSFAGGRYFFTESRKPTIDTLLKVKASFVSETEKPKLVASSVTHFPKHLAKQKNKKGKKIQTPKAKEEIKTFVSTQPQEKADSSSKVITQIQPTSPTRERYIERIRPIPTAFVKIEEVGKMEKTILTDSSILNLYEPSGFIYANKDGNLIIVLPDPIHKHFTFKVFREDGTSVFSMKNIREPELLIDKSNFLHSGWFKYELSESGKIREKNKFFIPSQIK